MRNLTWLAALAMLALVGCTSMDQRSDEPDKKPLVAFESPLRITPKWANDTGEGTDNKDLKLLLAQDNKMLYTVDAHGKVTVLVNLEQKLAQPEWTQLRS